MNFAEVMHFFQIRAGGWYVRNTEAAEWKDQKWYHFLYQERKECSRRTIWGILEEMLTRLACVASLFKAVRIRSILTPQDTRTKDEALPSFTSSVG
jgi:hypothetical protein